MTQIHPTAIVETGAQLGEQVEIGPHCVVGANVELGDRCVLRSNVVIEGPSTIGNDNIFYPFTYIGAPPQDMKYKGEPTKLEIGDNNQFRECVSIHRGTVTGGGRTVIGNHNLLMGYVHVAHDCVLGNHNVLANYTGLSGHVVMDDFVTLGGQNGVTQFVHIGSYAYTGAGSLIDKHLAPYTTGYGNRFEIKGINIVGLKRKGFSRDVINHILESHRIFFRQDLKPDEALRQIEEAYGDVSEVRLFTDFVRRVDGAVRK
jgi:UDP-N-acetylglucosamine acyltransferase